MKYTVNGITGTLSELAKHFKVVPQTAYARKERNWSIEQCLGLKPAPPNVTTVSVSVPDLPRLGTKEANWWAILEAGISAEEYLRREGVGPGSIVLSDVVDDEI